MGLIRFLTEYREAGEEEKERQKAYKAGLNNRPFPPRKSRRRR